jgi:hypothetical protein
MQGKAYNLALLTVSIMEVRQELKELKNRGVLDVAQIAIAVSAAAIFASAVVGVNLAEYLERERISRQAIKGVLAKQDEAQGAATKIDGDVLEFPEDVIDFPAY